jgi:2-phosphosulfolactate phosphatase
MDYAVEASKRNKMDILFLCAGKWGEVSYDDVYVAGLGIRYVVERCDRVELSDTALLSLNAASNEKDIFEALIKSQSGAFSILLGLEEDVRFCSRIDAYKIIGVLEVIAGSERGSPTFLIKSR